MRGISMYGHDFFVIKEDEDLISESISRLFNTNQNERVKNPFMGVDIRNMLFELADEDSEGILKNKISEQIEMYEPRVIIRKLDVENVANENLFKIKVSFSLTKDPQSENFLDFNIIKEEE